MTNFANFVSSPITTVTWHDHVQLDNLVLYNEFRQYTPASSHCQPYRSCYKQLVTSQVTTAAARQLSAKWMYRDCATRPTLCRNKTSNVTLHHMSVNCKQDATKFTKIGVLQILVESESVEGYKCWESCHTTANALAVGINTTKYLITNAIIFRSLK